MYIHFIYTYTFFSFISCKLFCRRYNYNKKKCRQKWPPRKQKPQPSFKPPSFSLLFSTGKATTAGERKSFLLATEASRHHFIQQIQEKKAAEQRQRGRTNPERRRLGPLSGLLLPNEELSADRTGLLEETALRQAKAHVSIQAWKEERAFYCPLIFFTWGEKNQHNKYITDIMISGCIVEWLHNYCEPEKQLGKNNSHKIFYKCAWNIGQH